MPQYMTKMNAQTLLTVLERTGHVTPQENKWLGDYIVEHNREEELPKLLRLLIGVGAALSSAFLIWFLNAADVINFNSAVQLTLWGGMFIAYAVLMARWAEGFGLVGHSFLIQSSFCSIGIGKFMFVLGCVEGAEPFMRHEGWAAGIGMLVVTLVTWPFYKMTLDRFLSSAAVMCIFLFNILFDRSLGEARELVLNAFGLAQLAAVAVLFTNGRIAREYMPAGYAVLASLGATVAVFASEYKMGWGGHAFTLDPWFMNLFLSAALIGLIGWAAGDMKKLGEQALGLAAAGAALLGMVSAPGIIFAIGLMILGYARQEKLLIALGGLAMPFFLWLYYYNMDIALMQKSGVLVASGAVLLTGKLYLSARNIGREERT